jgi:uncharacterized protein (TIGR04255 family)
MLLGGQRFDARCLFHHVSEDRLIQLQNDRFVLNWRRGDSDEKYAGYERIRLICEREWERFNRFLDASSIKRPVLRACEVTYINQLEKGNGWDSFGDLKKVIRNWTDGAGSNFLPAPSAIAMSVTYPMPDTRGTLTVQLEPAVRLNDGVEILQLVLTARGKPESAETSALLAWFDFGHEWIVRGFDGFTARAMHEIWGKR